MRIWDEAYQKWLEILAIVPIKNGRGYRIGYYSSIYPRFYNEDYTTRDLSPDALISICIDPAHNWYGGYED
jgi:hypothetical protein